MTKQIFLGGACGETDWRQKIAIPLFEAGGITYYSRSLGLANGRKNAKLRKRQSY